MKKVAISILLIGLLAGSAFPFKLGLEFGVSDGALVGANMRFTESFELKPQLGFVFIEDNSFMHLIFDANFYLPEIMELQHYAGPRLDLYVQGDDSKVALDGHYGLLYNFNDVLSMFGQVGLRVEFGNNPTFGTIRSALECTIYFPNFL